MECVKVGWGQGQGEWGGKTGQGSGHQPVSRD